MATLNAPLSPVTPAGIMDADYNELSRMAASTSPVGARATEDYTGSEGAVFSAPALNAAAAVANDANADAGPSTPIPCDDGSGGYVPPPSGGGGSVPPPSNGGAKAWARSAAGIVSIILVIVVIIGIIFTCISGRLGVLQKVFIVFLVLVILAVILFAINMKSPYALSRSKKDEKKEQTA